MAHRNAKHRTSVSGFCSDSILLQHKLVMGSETANSFYQGSD